jgi:hypothetical protein
MKPYGLVTHDYDCCFGHSKYPTHWHGRFHSTKKNNLIRKTAKARERRYNKVTDYTQIIAAANDPEDDDDWGDLLYSDLEDEFDNVLTCDIGTNLDKVEHLDGCKIVQDSDDYSIFAIKDPNGKIVGKIYIYDD